MLALQKMSTGGYDAIISDYQMPETDGLEFLKLIRSKDDPIPFALAEYNAGRKRVDRWVESTKLGEAATAADLRGSIGFPTTRGYVNTILKRRACYEQEPKD